MFTIRTANGIFRPSSSCSLNLIVNCRLWGKIISIIRLWLHGMYDNELHGPCWLRKAIKLYSSDPREGIFGLIWSIPYLLMPWLLKWPEYQQAWYWQHMNDRQHIGLLHCEFGLLLNKIQDDIRNVNTYFIIFKTIQHIKLTTPPLHAPWSTHWGLKKLDEICRHFWKHFV